MKITLFRFLLLLGVAVLLVIQTACKSENETSYSHSSPPILVTTIKPLHLLVAAIAGDQFETHTLIPVGASPHFYTLKPSDRQRLSQAKVIFRVHPSLEQHLNKTLKTLAPAIQQVNLAEAPNIHLRHFDHIQTTKTHGTDTHIWLDPKNAIAMSQAISQNLQTVDPKNAHVYANNADALIKSIQQTDKNIKAQLKPLQKHPYLVQHDAWQYFEKHYQLNKVASINGLSGQSIGAASLRRLFRLIKTQGIQCLFIDPGFEPKLANLLTRETGIKTAILDPVGANLSIQFNSYPMLLQQAADSIEACLMKPD